jgi:hypothetical protein
MVHHPFLHRTYWDRCAAHRRQALLLRMVVRFPHVGAALARDRVNAELASSTRQQPRPGHCRQPAGHPYQRRCRRWQEAYQGITHAVQRCGRQHETRGVAPWAGHGRKFEAMGDAMEQGERRRGRDGQRQRWTHRQGDRPAPVPRRRYHFPEPAIASRRSPAARRAACWRRMCTAAPSAPRLSAGRPRGRPRASPANGRYRQAGARRPPAGRFRHGPGAPSRQRVKAAGQCRRTVSSSSWRTSLAGQRSVVRRRRASPGVR